LLFLLFLFYSALSPQHSALDFTDRLYPASIQIILGQKTEFFLNETAVNGNIFGVFINDRLSNRRFYTNGVASLFN